MHVEIQSRKKKKYYYLVETLRINSRKWKKVRIYLGSNLKQHEIDNLTRRKSPELEDKIIKTKRASDPLLSVISESQIKELEKIRELHKRRLQKMDNLQYKNYYERFVSEFTYDTNAIEGSTLTLNETAMILFDKIVPKGKQIREINEVQNHKDAFDFILGYKEDLTKAFVLRMHKMLMHNILWKYAGVFRDVQVYIRGADFTPPPPEQVEAVFKRLMLWYRRNKKKYHPVVVAGYFHHVFESIHPFRDGNGRIGRLLLNFILRKNGFPMIDIKYKDRSDYYSALQSANKGNLKPLAEMIIAYLKEARLI